jgi:RNA polymerase sigma-70 factor (ECF subfamily)
VTVTANEQVLDVELRDAMVSYQQGSLDAFERLYAALAGPLRRFLHARCRDAALADDLLQETFLQIHRSRHTYRAEHPVRPWAFGIAQHVVLMHTRAQARRLRREGADPDPVESRSHEDALVDRDRLRQALGGLPADRREAVLLHHVVGFRFSEIARRLGIRAGAAKVRASRGMAALRARLVDKEE